ncbi:hypothetical protein [Bifidobacterium choloepi]|uniref:DUF5105 domain-containing protein n=1 Tax=Bifidobacterium choloepi TaxID=2614131 RepID=A0A6I5N0A1_9BIFI|nr:hypothetical protein [Bifidobacterium choloepi]NEG69936.1 hypothetical protein [Bifidobacterium choloepi]
MGKVRQILGIAACAVLTVAVAGCGSQGSIPADSEKVYTNEEVIGMLEDGLRARFALTAGEDDAPKGDQQVCEECDNVEYDKISGLRYAKFEDSKLQEKVISYLNTLEESKEVISHYSFDDLQLYSDWDAVYDNKTVLLKDFVNDYGLKLGGNDQKVLDELVANGKTVTKANEVKKALTAILEKVQFTCPSEEDSNTDPWGLFDSDCEAVIDNSTQYSFADLYLTASLYDADNVKTEKTVSIDSMKAGEKVKVQVAPDANTKDIKLSISSYTLVK